MRDLELGASPEGGRGFLDRFFSIRARGSTVGTEIRAGTTTFLTVAYALFINPPIMIAAGMPAQDAAVATALSIAIGTLVMGLWANLPFVIVPGMSLALYFTYGVAHGMGATWQQALAAVFIEGIIFLLISLGGFRAALINAIPANLKIAITVGIGLFIAFAGMRSAGLVEGHSGSLVTLGNLQSPSVLLSLVGLFAMGALSALRVRGALLIGISAITLVAWLSGIAEAPTQIFAMPGLPQETFFAFQWNEVFTPAMFSVVFAFLFVDVFDTAGTMLAVGRLGGFLDEKGELPNADKAFASDAVGTMVGASLGTCAHVVAIESAAGVEEGGRTGLTSLVAAGFFFLALFVSPIFAAIPAVATGPVVVIVGTLMMRGVKDLDWRQADESIPAFLTMVGMPFTFSIANGIALGLTSYVAIKVMSGKARDVPALLYGLVFALVFFYAFIKGF